MASPASHHNGIAAEKARFIDVASVRAARTAMPSDLMVRALDDDHIRNLVEECVKHVTVE